MTMSTKVPRFFKLGNVLPNYNRSIAVMACRYGAGARDVLDFGAGIGTLSQTVRELGLTPLCLEPDARQRAELDRCGFQTVARSPTCRTAVSTTSIRRMFSNISKMMLRP